MEESIPEALQELFIEFEDRTFTAEQASILCGISLEMIDELIEDGYLIPVEDGIRIVQLPESEV